MDFGDAIRAQHRLPRRRYPFVTSYSSIATMVPSRPIAPPSRRATTQPPIIASRGTSTAPRRRRHALAHRTWPLVTDTLRQQFAHEHPVFRTDCRSGQPCLRRQLPGDVAEYQRCDDGGNAYDADGLLVGVGELSIARDPSHGLRTGSTMAGVSDTFTRNTHAEVMTYAVTALGTTVYRIDFVRDALGRITRKTEVIQGATVVSDYQYDAAGRLTVATTGGSTSTYAYDANGNRTAFTGTPVNVPPAQTQYDAQDRMLGYGATIYAYTANGDLATEATGANTKTYTYDEFANLVRLVLPGGTTIDNLHDAADRRIQQHRERTLVKGSLYELSADPRELDEQRRCRFRVSSSQGAEPCRVHGPRRRTPIASSVIIWIAGAHRDRRGDKACPAHAARRFVRVLGYEPGFHAVRFSQGFRPRSSASSASALGGPVERRLATRWIRFAAASTSAGTVGSGPMMPRYRSAFSIPAGHRMLPVTTSSKISGAVRCCGAGRSGR